MDLERLGVHYHAYTCRGSPREGIKGEVRLYALELEVGGIDRKWKQKLVLHKESQIQASNLETKSKIEEAQKK